LAAAIHLAAAAMISCPLVAVIMAVVGETAMLAVPKAASEASLQLQSTKLALGPLSFGFTQLTSRPLEQQQALALISLDVHL
jgi:hypothetical protein